jgi:uncharacterized membrane protein
VAETWTLPFAGGDASTGFALDDLTLALLVGSMVLVVAVAAGAFIVVEGRRIGMRRAWIFLPLAAVTAAAFAIPLFLALRERKLAAAHAEGPRP